MFKLLVVGKKDGIDVTLSRKIHALAEAGDKTSQFFDPHWIDRINWYEEKQWTDTAYIDEFTDPEQTAIAHALAAQWREGSILHPARIGLGVTPETEKPYEVFVVEKTSTEVNQDIGGAAYCIIDPVPIIVLPSDYRNRVGYFSHEYGHSQSKFGLMMGNEGVLFRGINEAHTDIVTGNSNYVQAIEVENTLKRNIDGFEEYIDLAYKGDQQAQFDLLVSIANKYGVEAILALARLVPSSNPRFTNFVEQSVYLRAEEVLNYFIF